MVKPASSSYVDSYSFASSFFKHTCHFRSTCHEKAQGDFLIVTFCLRDLESFHDRDSTRYLRSVVKIYVTPIEFCTSDLPSNYLGNLNHRANDQPVTKLHTCNDQYRQLRRQSIFLLPSNEFEEKIAWKVTSHFGHFFSCAGNPRKRKGNRFKE